MTKLSKDNDSSSKQTSFGKTVCSPIQTDEAANFTGRYETTAVSKDGQVKAVLRSLRNAPPEDRDGLVIQGSITPRRAEALKKGDVENLCATFDEKAKVTAKKPKKQASVRFGNGCESDDTKENGKAVVKLSSNGKRGSGSGLKKRDASSPNKASNEPALGSPSVRRSRRISKEGVASSPIKTTTEPALGSPEVRRSRRISKEGDASSPVKTSTEPALGSPEVRRSRRLSKE